MTELTINRKPIIMKIIIADDEKMILVVLRRYLTRKGHETIEAASALQAIQAFDANPEVGLIITDLAMEAGESGLEVLRHARNVSATVKLCLTSGSLTDEVARKANLLGAEVFSKPYDMNELCSKLGI